MRKREEDSDVLHSIPNPVLPPRHILSPPLKDLPSVQYNTHTGLLTKLE